MGSFLLDCYSMSKPKVAEMKIKVSPVKVTCVFVVLILLFTSPLFAKGLTLSLSDSELGSIVLKKPNPDKNWADCLWGLTPTTGSHFRYRCIGGQKSGTTQLAPWEWRDLEKQLGYTQEYQISMQIYDEKGPFINIDGGGGTSRYFPNHPVVDENALGGAGQYKKIMAQREALHQCR